MKRMLATAGIVLLALGGVMAQQARTPAGAPASGAVAKALVDLENQWAKAARESNGDALAAMLAEDFVMLNSDGTQHGKAEVIARTKKAKWTTFQVADMKVTAHGDSAIITGSWSGVGTDGGGQSVNAKERWVDTWVKMPDGKWLCVASASAPSK
jgi:ketosteroid isomerase-like protein